MRGGADKKKHKKEIKGKAKKGFEKRKEPVERSETDEGMGATERKKERKKNKKQGGKARKREPNGEKQGEGESAKTFSRLFRGFCLLFS